MCELFGINGSKKIAANGPLKEFYSHSVKHPHGWGLAYKSQGKMQIEKEAITAVKSQYLQEFLDKDINSDIVIGHIRYATIGNVETVNSHPFQAQDNSGRT